MIWTKKERMLHSIDSVDYGLLRPRYNEKAAKEIIEGLKMCRDIIEALPRDRNPQTAEEFLRQFAKEMEKVETFKNAAVKHGIMKKMRTKEGK